MKNILCFDINSVNEKSIDITNIINKISELMKLEYPSFYDWFNSKVLPGLNDGSRNIVVLCKNDKIIGFANIKNTEKEKKISNIYIKGTLFYESYWNILVDKALELLDEEYPVVIASSKDINKCAHLMDNRGWYFSDRSKNNDYILNRFHELEKIRKNFLKNKKAN